MGLVPTMPDIGADEISFLIAMEWLDEADAADRRAVGCAIKRMIADAARRR
jgi:hypothetical protein